MAIKRSPSKRMQIIWNLWLLVVLFASLPISYLGFHYISSPSFPLFGDYSLPLLLTVWGVGFFVRITIESLFDNFNLSKEILASFTNSFFASIIAEVAAFFVTNAIFDDSSFWILSIISFGVYLVLAVVIRYAIYLASLRKKRDILIVGQTEEAKNLAKKFLMNSHKSIKFIFFINNGDDLPKGLHTSIKQCQEVYLTSNLSSRVKDHIILYCVAKRDIDVFVVPTSYEIGMYDAHETNVDDILTFKARELRLSLWQRIFKRAFDIFCSLIGLLIVWPIMLIAAIIIKAQDGGPAIFRQERVTVDDKPFTLVKFRSMTVDAEKETGAVLASKEDPRVTKFGRFIRATRIDELPQLWNVLKGEMSFVGPRPERVAFVNEFQKETPEYRYRSNVKAGITGLAQTKGRYDTKYQDKLRWDLLYIRNYSFIADIKIIIRTILAVFNKTSAQGIDCSKDLEEMLAQHNLEIIAIDHHWEIKSK